MVHNVRFTQRIGFKKEKYITKGQFLIDFKESLHMYVQAKIRDQSVHCVNDRYMAKI